MAALMARRKRTASRRKAPPKPAPGVFITFEGGEGAGKSTQIERLRRRLEQRGLTVVATREPGGSPGAEVVRRLLLSGKVRELGSEAEAILFAAARADHVDRTIAPALAAGSWVLCDRFTDSTRVYQGEAGVDPALLEALERVAVGKARPDLTILIDVPADIGLERVRVRSGPEAPDRFEQDDLAVHQRRRQLFLDLARGAPHRFAVVDGSGDADAVEAAIWREVSRRFDLDPNGGKSSTSGVRKK